MIVCSVCPQESGVTDLHSLPINAGWTIDQEGRGITAIRCPRCSQRLRGRKDDERLEAHGVPLTEPDWVKDFEKRTREKKGSP